MIDKFWSKVFIILTMAVIVSCGDTPTCLDTETSLVKVNFVDVDGKAKNITLTSLKAVNNEDGFPEYADSTLNNLNLPLNPGSYTTTFILAQAGVTDTLGLTYDVVAKLISPECGLDVSFDKLKIDYTTYNSINILQTAIHEDVIVNIEITL